MDAVRCKREAATMGGVIENEQEKEKEEEREDVHYLL